ncbi:antibiotic biosynthesis monooxygenase [Pseudonocardia sp. N23]|uniref:antibiotic biosynthesis monooxygenase family protein n=1 Tax=Pseudonocardia sp. N23 TaxID=1987376 RepID=UPI000BFD54EA|nr:antibiotic biosynthesis monooxygenase family protein [Pseudonocardia sp. N23]GAY09527.1 antibiotic biosynthesis monooxygenase [Pseudonocardia sp. N23]
MVLEIADFDIRPGTEDQFAAAYLQARDLLAATPGFVSARMTRGIESPSRFVLLVEWQSVEAHTVGFRGSDRFPKWREIIGPFFAGDPRVEHAQDVR